MGKHKTAREQLNQKLSKAESVEEKKKIYLEYLQFLKDHDDRWFAKVAQGPFPWYDRNPKGVASLDEKQLRAGKGPYGLQIIPAKKAKYGSNNLYQGMFNRLHAKKSAIEEDQEKYEKLLHDIDHPDEAKSESELTTSSKRRTKTQAKKESEERSQVFHNILKDLVAASSRKDDLTKSIDGIASKLGSKTKEKGLDEPHKDDVLEYINDLEKEIDAEEKLIKEKDTRALENEFSVPSKPAYRNLVVPDKNNRTKKFSEENRHLHNKSNPYGDGEPWNGFVLETRKRLKDIKALRKSLMETRFDLVNADTETYLDEDADKSFSDIDTNPDVSQLSNLTGEIKDDVGDLRDLEDLHAIKEQIKRSSAQVAHPTASRNQAIKERRALSKSNLKNERRSSAEKNILSAYEQNPSIKKQQQEEKLRNAVSILDKRTLADVSGVPRTTLSLNRGRNTNIRIPIKDVAQATKIHEGEIPVNEHLKAKEEILGKITENTPPEQKVAVYEEYLDYLLEYGLNKSPELKALLFEEANAIKQKIQEIEGIHDQDQDQDQAQAEFLAEEEGVPQEIIEQTILNNSQIAPQKMTIRDKQKDLRDQIARINSREDLDNPIRQRSRRQSIQNILQQHPKQERSRSLSQSGIGLNALNKEAEAHDDIDDATDRKKQILEDIYLKNEDINNKLAKYKHWHNVKKNAKKRERTLAELKETAGFEPKLNKPANMDDRNKEFQLTQHQQLIEAFRKLMDKDTEINKNQRHANKDPKIIAADKQIFSNQANIGDRKAIFKEQRDKLRGTYNEDTYIKLHKNLNDENVLKNYMDKLIIPAEENRVIKEIKKQNQKALKNAGFNITTTLLKNGMFLGPSKAVLEAIAQEKVERRTNKDIQNYLAKDEVNRMNAALHQIEHDNKKLENMAKHAQSVEAQLSNEKRLNEAADYKDIQNLRAIGENDEAREQRELDLQNQEWYLEQERPKTKLKELLEALHLKNGVPTYFTPPLRMQLEKRDVISSSHLGSNIVQGAARLMNYGNMDDDYNRQSRRRNASGGHIAQYAHGGSPMGTPDEYKLESYDPRNANTQEDSSFWDRLKANTKWTPENTRKWGAFMAGIDKGHSGIDESMEKYYRNRDEQKSQEEALMFRIEESREKQAQRELEFNMKQAKEERKAAMEERKLAQSDEHLKLSRDKFNYDKELDRKKSSDSKSKFSSEESALIKELQKKSMKSKSWLNPFDDSKKIAQQALKLINAGVPPMEALQRSQGISTESPRRSKSELLSAVGG